MKPTNQILLRRGQMIVFDGDSLTRRCGPPSYDNWPYLRLMNWQDSYADRVAEGPWVNGASPDPGPVDLDRGLALYRRTMLGLTALIGALAVLGM